VTDRTTTSPRVSVARWDELDARTAYDILRLRSEVFVVEQQCAFADMDGRDLEPSARHLWIALDGRVVSALRVLRDADGSHQIGRVVTVAEHRGQGLGALLMRHAVEVAGSTVWVRAQAHLAPWYATFGFDVSGDGWIEDGIPHVPMRLHS
jgi:ElaA protein